jgi:hypothetical protein
MNHFTLAILPRFFVLVVEPQFGPLHCGLEKGGMDQSSRGAQPPPFTPDLNPLRSTLGHRRQKDPKGDHRKICSLPLRWRDSLTQLFPDVRGPLRIPSLLRRDVKDRAHQIIKSRTEGHDHSYRPV